MVSVKKIYGEIKSMFLKRCAIFLAAASLLGSLCAEEKPYVRKGAPRFSERYMNLRLFVKPADRAEFSSLEPDGAGFWRYRADEAKPTALGVDGKNGSQLYLKMKVGEGLKESIIYLPSGKAFFTLPAAKQVSDDARNEIPKGGTAVRMSPPNYKELSQYRNLAMNPYDFQDGADEKDLFYPHATASTECRNELIFRARNAIDGVSDNNLRHGGWKHRSWGPEKEESPWIRIDFGRPVELDKAVLTLRADFPHDGYWESGELAFSGTKKTVPVKFKKTEAPQEFKFPKIRTTYIELRKLKTQKPVGWCALAEFEAWGVDVMPFAKKGNRKLSFLDALSTMSAEGVNEVKNLWLWRMLGENFPIDADHLMRDFGTDLSKLPDAPEARAKAIKALAKKAFDEIENKSGLDSLKSEIEKAESLTDAIRAYQSAAKKRRLEFLSKLEGKPRRYVYVERYPIAPSFYGYTEAVSDARSEMRFAPDSNLCMLEIKPDGSISRTVLISDKGGTLRDPDISYDGAKILFSWKKSALEDDYHLYEMDIASRKVRQITTGVNADIEGKYLPTGEIVFNSTRCEQATDCWHTEVSNLYMMKPDGSFLRRVGFDQVCTTYPTVTEQGNVVYTRWDYNDRGQTFTQALFSMKPDGSFQTEVYGNKSWYPTTIGHARQIPNTNKYIATLHGHHTAQRGKLAEIDPSKGRQEDSGVELLAPRRKEKAVRIDGYGQRGEQFQYPFPLEEGLFLVTFQQYDAENRSYPLPYGLYLMDSEGRRELLARHEYLDCKQAVAVAPRKIPQLEKSRVDYTKDKGYLFIRNIYYGAGVDGVEKGSIKKVRIVKIDYRHAAVGGMNGRNDEGGVGVANHVCTPIGLGQASWDTKEILGEVDVAPDGSVYFEVPARTPVYFQPIDKNGNAVTTMRSWTAMQPNEFYSCLGCHGDRDTPNPIPLRIAKGRKPEKPKPFYDVKGGFSFQKYIQPILDKHCISCHNDRGVARILTHDGKEKVSVESIAKTEGKKWLDLERENSKKSVRAFSLLNYPIENRRAKRIFNDAYYNLLQPQMDRDIVCYADFKNPVINWNGMQSVPTLLPPYHRGAAKSEIMRMLKSGHGKTKLSQEELDKFAAWIDLYVPYCGDYYEANAWSERDMDFYKYYEAKGEANAAAEKVAIEKYLKLAAKKSEKKNIGRD